MSYCTFGYFGSVCLYTGSWAWLGYAWHQTDAMGQFYYAHRWDASQTDLVMHAIEMRFGPIRPHVSSRCTLGRFNPIRYWSRECHQIIFWVDLYVYVVEMRIGPILLQVSIRYILGHFHHTCHWDMLSVDSIIRVIEMCFMLIRKQRHRWHLKRKTVIKRATRVIESII